MKATLPSFFYSFIPRWDDRKKCRIAEAKQAWINTCRHIKRNDLELLTKLPNFDAAVFEEITGLSGKYLRQREILFRKF